MKLGVLTNLLGSVSLEEALKYFKSLGLEMVEIGCGGFPGKAHADPDILLNDDKALEDFKALLKNMMLKSAHFHATATLCIPIRKWPSAIMMILSTPCCWLKSWV